MGNGELKVIPPAFCNSPPAGLPPNLFDQCKYYLTKPFSFFFFLFFFLTRARPRLSCDTVYIIGQVSFK